MNDDTNAGPANASAPVQRPGTTGPSQPPTTASRPDRAPAKRPHPAQRARPIILLLILAVIAFFVWRNATRREGYNGGDVTSTGTVDADQVQLSFKVGGQLSDVPVTEGDRVQAGQIVARLDTRDLDVALASSRTELMAARAGVAQARANRERAAHDLARQQALVSTGATTMEALDTARASARVADAEVAAAVARVDGAVTALDRAQLQRSYADLKSPVPGLVSEKVHRPGEVVVIGTPVVVIAEVDTVKVHAAIDETRIGAVRPGDPVRVRVATFDKRVFDGQVTDIQPAGEFATRKDWGAQRRDIKTFTVTARVPNPDLLLKDGMTADVTVVVAPAVKQMVEAKR